MKRQFIISLASLALVACSTAVPLQRGDTATLSKGLAIEETTKNLGKATVVISHEFVSHGSNYLANHYNLQTGTRQEMGMICSPICIAYPIQVPIFSPYVTIYQGSPRQLFAWGQLEELSRSPDESISSIMPDLKNSLAAETAKKKNH